MTVKPCRDCGRLVPTAGGQWERHRQNHQSAKRTQRLPYDWKTIRRQVLARDGHRCQKCGRHETMLKPLGIPLEVHHRFGPEDSRLDALVTLCRSCHPRPGPTNPQL